MTLQQHTVQKLQHRFQTSKLKKLPVPVNVEFIVFVRTFKDEQQILCQN